MTRSEALRSVRIATTGFRHTDPGPDMAAAPLVRALEALGLLKFDDPQIDRDEGRYRIRLHADEWTAAAKQGGASRLSEKIIRDLERDGFRIVRDK